MAILTAFPGIAALSRPAGAQPAPRPAPPPPAPAKPAVDATALANATLIATFVETGSLDAALERNPAAKLTDAQLKLLRAIPPAELAAVLKFQGRLAAAQLPQLVLRRETIARLTTAQDAGVVLERTNANLTNRPGDTVRPGATNLTNRTNTPPTNQRRR